MSSKTMELTLVGFAALAIFLTLKSLLKKEQGGNGVVNTQYGEAWSEAKIYYA